MSQSYDNPTVISYNMGELDLGAGAEAPAIRIPAGKKFARIEEIHVAVSETFTAVTTPGYVRLGTAADADKFVELNMGTAADTNGYGTSDDADAIKSAGKFIDLDRDGDAGVALTQLELNTVQPTGGTPAGRGYLTVAIAWW